MPCATASPITQRTGVVVVSYAPPADFAQRLQSLQQLGLAVAWVANGRAMDGKNACTCKSLSATTTLIDNSCNLGIAAALNQGLAHLRGLGCSRALLLDQDSDLPAATLEALQSALDALPSAMGVVPIIAHPLAGMRCRWPQALRENGLGGWRFRFIYGDALRAPAPVHVAISSGMLIRLDRSAALNDFDADLFIDLVDTDFCLRALSHGWPFYAIPGTTLDHSIGSPQRRRILGLIPAYPTHHSPMRHYYLARNRITLYRRHAASFPFWAIYETLGALKHTMKALLFEQQRWGKLKAMARGTVAGIKKRA